MKLEVLKCPSCGANIEFEEGIESCDCEYCGAKVTVAPSKENKNNVAETIKKFAEPKRKTYNAKSNNNKTSQEGSIRKGITFIFNAAFIVSLLFTGLLMIIAITDADVSMVFFALFCLIYGIMFKVLALTPKGSKYILGKKKGLKPVYFVLICFLLSFMMIMLSPTSEEDTTDSDASVSTEQVIETE